MISGNTGIGVVTLRYIVGTANRTLTSDISGNYAFPVPNNWSGTVTPSLAGYTFTPAKRTYTKVTTDQSQQNYIATPTTSATLPSVGQYDGWILESSEISNQGGTFNAAAATFQLGDDSLNRQYRAILSFDTSSLPVNATIASATLRIKPSGKPVGGNPFTLLGSLLVDIRKGAFGKTTLEAADFQAAATAKKVGIFGKKPVSGWYNVTLNAAGMNNINKTGVTQFRLYFTKDDNNNLKAEFMKFFSGNAATSKPEMVITYTMP
jgi:hypothetical protein